MCAGEAFANAVNHSRSQRPGGTVVRLLSTPLVMGRQTTLRLSVTDDGPREHCQPPLPSPTPHHAVEDWETTESGRGLLLIHHLADERGTRKCPASHASTHAGTVLWAEFTYLTRACTCGGVS